ncbi:MAG: S8 family serine peptidase [Thermoleophilaceae bacterium]
MVSAGASEGRRRLRAALIAGVLMGLLSLGVAARAEAAHPTGRYLVTFEKGSTARSSAALSATLARAGVQRSGRGVPALSIATVRGGSGALARLRRDTAVRSVSVEWERDLRRMPNDPALSTPETRDTDGVAPGTPIQWALVRQGFPSAWGVTTGQGAIVGAVDSGVDGSIADMSGKIASADAVGTSAPTSDPDGHGTHTAGLACAATDNAVGIAGAGWGCRLAVVKLGQGSSGGISDQDIIEGIRIAVDRGAQAINLSFGGGDPNAALSQVIDYAVSRGVVLVAAASNNSDVDQGAPASLLQPGNAPDLGAGRGLVVTAADFSDRRAGTGLGNQISVASYGFFDDGPLGPPGLISTFPASGASREGTPPLFAGGCGCRRAIGSDDDYSYLAGTSMATPQVTGLAALVSALNPYLSLRDKLTLIKQRARGRGAWGPELGWGIIDAGATVDAARRVDRLAAASKARSKRRVRARRGARRAKVRVRWSASDPAGRTALIPSGVRDADLDMRKDRGKYRRVKRSTRKRSALLRLKPGVYRLYTRARDRAGNREAVPRKADVRLVVERAKRR